MKVTKEKTNTARRPKWGWLLLAAAVILVVDLILFLALRDRQAQPELPEVSSETVSEGSTQEAQPELPPAVAGEREEQGISFSLDFGLEITAVGAYTGAYVEDGSNEVVSGVMMITVVNSGEESIQYAEIYLETADGEAKFSLTTLLPGESAVLLEQNRAVHRDGVAVSGARTENVALFSEAPSLCEDKLEIGVLDGAVNVTNISGEAIEGDVVIYYKNYSEGLYYGGITYRIRIEGGMEAGEIRQMMAEHFSASGSRVVFVTCG